MACGSGISQSKAALQDSLALSLARPPAAITPASSTYPLRRDSGWLCRRCPSGCRDRPSGRDGVSRHDRPLHCRCADARSFVQNGVKRYNARGTPSIRGTPQATLSHPHAHARPPVHAPRPGVMNRSGRGPSVIGSSSDDGRAELCDILVLRRPATGTRRCRRAWYRARPLAGGHRRNGCTGIA
jgi:hypothetical protein